MRVSSLLPWALLALLCPGAPLAAQDRPKLPQKPIVAPKLPRPISPEMLAARKKLALDVALRLRRKHADDDRKRIDSLDRAVAQARANFQAAAKSDDEYQAFLAATRKTLEKPNGSLRKALAPAFAQRSAKLRQLLHATDKDWTTVRTKFQPLNPGVLRPDLTLLYHRPKSEQTQNGGEPLPTDLVFQAPFVITDAQTEKAGPGFTEADARVRPTDSEMSLSASATSIGAFCSARASGLAAIPVTAPAGYRTMHIQTQYRYDFTASAFAALGIGAASVFADLIVCPADDAITLRNLENGEILFDHGFDVESLIAAVAYYVESENEEIGVFEGDVTLPSAGGDFLVMLLVESAVTGAGGGGGELDVSFEPVSFQVQFRR